MAAGFDYEVVAFSNGSAVATSGTSYGTLPQPANGAHYTDVALSGADLHGWESGQTFGVALSSDGTVVEWGEIDTNTYPVPVTPAGRSVVAVEAGSNFAVALRDDGTAVTWGPGASSVQPVSLPTGLRYTQVAAGNGFVMAVRSDGVVIGWGGAVSAPQPPAGTRFVKVAAGNAHAIGLLDNGTVLGWGYEADGAASPPPPPLGQRYVDIDTGAYFSIAITSSGEFKAWGAPYCQSTTGPSVPNGSAIGRAAAGRCGGIAVVEPAPLAASSVSAYAWGSGTNGQLGVGGPNDTADPTALSGGYQWSSISSGYYHSCAIKPVGTLWCWGNNSAGQLGNGTTTPTTTPTQVGSASDWMSVSAGGYHTCALKTDASLWCWGSNGSGQVGNASLADQRTPASIAASRTWLSIAAGWAHTCAVGAAGTLWCWGDNGWGELGVGDQQNRSAPVQVGSATSWASVTTNWVYSCATRLDGTLWCWGYNGAGQLGDGTTSNRSQPTRIGSSTGWAGVSAGSYHTCGTQFDGSLWCWGDNSTGQLGLGDLQKRYSPTRVGAENSWKEVSDGDFHTCAIRSTGTLWCWGSNQFGQLGDGTFGDRSTPGQVGVLDRWREIDLHHRHSLALLAPPETVRLEVTRDGAGSGTVTSSPAAIACGTTCGADIGYGGTVTLTALPASNSVFTGWSGGGCTGTGTCSVTATEALAVTAAFALSPTVASFAPLSGGVGLAVAVSGSHLEGVSAVRFNGLDAPFVVLSGSALVASVPVGATTGPIRLTVGSSTVSTAVFTVQDKAVKPTVTGYEPRIVRVGALAVVTLTGKNFIGATAVTLNGVSLAPISVHSGTSMTVAVPASGASSGAIRVTAAGGTSTNVNVLAVNPAPASVAGGAAHSCARMADGSARCWGLNTRGQLGDGTTTQRTTSALVLSAPNVPLAGVTAVAAGAAHSCALVTGGAIRCWGSNANGQLGSGSTASQSYASSVVSGISTATQVSAGNAHTCARLSDGTAQCWGLNSNGGLGDGTTTRRTAPVPVLSAAGVPLTGIVSITAGIDHTCAVLVGGTVRCWGANTNGQLGTGSTTTLSYASTAVPGMATATQVSVGSSFSCARLSDGSVRCWGLNTSGQIGDGTTTQRTTPVTVLSASGTPLTGVASISAGGSRVCAVLLGGSVRCWGSNTNGQLGTGSTTSLRYASTAMTGVSAATEVATGDGHTLVLAASGTLTAVVASAGLNGNGRLGDGTTSQRTTAVLALL